MNDDFLKLRLDKLESKQRQEVLKYLLKINQDDNSSKKNEYQLVSMAEFTEAAIEIYNNWGKFQGISSGYKSIDLLTRGFVGGEVTVIAAKTSVGKTALAVNISNNVALQQIPVLFVTLEMTKAQLTSRFLYLNNGETDDYMTVSTLVSFQKVEDLNWQSIDGLIGSFCTQFTNGLVVIDHLHYFTRELEKVSDDLGRVTKELSKNAHQYNVPIILISHVRKGNGTITMEDLRGSSYIAQDADIVLLCGRSDDGSQLGVSVEKNRNRGIDPVFNEVQLTYDKTRITEWII